MNDEQTALTTTSDSLWEKVSAANRGDKMALAELRKALSDSQADALIASRPLESEKYGDEKIARAERRHLSAIKMLAQVRKLALPQRIDLTGNSASALVKRAAPRLPMRMRGWS